MALHDWQDDWYGSAVFRKGIGVFAGAFIKKDFACDKKDAGSHEPASFFACRYSIINTPVQTEDNLRAR